MVQGAIKKAKLPAKAAALKPKKGRIIAPKKTPLIQQKQMDKKLSAGINRNIESIMTERADGHLTILKAPPKTDDAKAKDGKKAKGGK